MPAKDFFRIRQPIEIFTGKPKPYRAAQTTVLDRNFSLDPEFAFLFDNDVLDVELRIAPRKSERTIIELQMFERFLPGEFRQLFQKRNIVDSPVTDAQPTFAG